MHVIHPYIVIHFNIKVKYPREIDEVLHFRPFFREIVADIRHFRSIRGRQSAIHSPLKSIQGTDKEKGSLPSVTSLLIVIIRVFSSS